MLDIIYYDTQIKSAAAADLPKLKKKKVWIDATAMTKEDAEILQKEYKLHPLTIDDLQFDKSRIKVEEFDHYLYCVFYGLGRFKKISLYEVDYIIGKNFLITHHDSQLPGFERIKGDRKRLEVSFTRGLDFLFRRLLEQEIDNFYPLLEELDNALELIEERVVKVPKPGDLRQILKLKRQAVIIKRHVIQQREKISFLAKNDYPFISKKAIPYFRDVYDHAIRVADTVDNYKESISEAFDAYMSAVNNSMNEVMKILSIFATLAMPMTVISSIYGTNFANLPGKDHWLGFWVMIFIMFAFSTGMVYMFRKKGWL